MRGSTRTSRNSGTTWHVRTLAAVVGAEVDCDELRGVGVGREGLVEESIDLVVAPARMAVVRDPLLGDVRRTRLERAHRGHVEPLRAYGRAHARTCSSCGGE
jgi:hypothetical protein